jgi:superfamily II DNA or RNA helicase
MDYFDTLTEHERNENLRLLRQYEKKIIEIKDDIIEIKDDDVIRKIEEIKIPNTQDGDLFKLGYDQLNDFQKPIINECIMKKFGGLSLALGSGKTIISIIVALYLTMNIKRPILVVVSKSLISNWEDEIEKFYGKKLKYKVVHSTVTDVDQWKIKSKTKLILTTGGCYC